MKRIDSSNVAAIRPGSRVWVKEWDEVQRALGFTPDGLLVAMGANGKTYLDPVRLSLYLLATEEPATVPSGVFYKVAEVNWI